MKPANRLVVPGIACAALCWMSQSSFADPAGFKLVVRGGEVRMQPLKGMNAKEVELTVDFKFGTKPVSDGLNPGEGSWMDRGMRLGEPTRLIYRTTRGNAENIAASLRNPRVKWAFWCNNTGKGYMDVTGDVQAEGPRPSRIDE